MTTDSRSASHANEAYLRQFGSGFCYCLALFIAHEAEFRWVRAEIDLMAADGAFRFEEIAGRNEAFVRRTMDQMAALRWFTQAEPVLRNLQIPLTIPGDLRSRLDQLKSKCHYWAFTNSLSAGPTGANVAWAIHEAKELVRAMDEHLGVPTTPEDRRSQSAREPSMVFRES